MSFINHLTNEINLKVVYCGPGLSGKTTNIQYIHHHTHPDRRGTLREHTAENERTLFFDFLPLTVGETRGFQTRFHLYTIPGQTFYDLSRQFILKGTDGIVFVVDSQEEQMEENIKAYDTLEKAMAQQGYDIGRIPLVFQYNKRDLPNTVSTQELEATFNPVKRPFFEAIATQGIGVMETLQEVSERILKDLKGGGTTS